MTAYAGPGFVGTIQTIKRIAAARYPERWKPEAIAAPEKEIWDSLGLTLNGEFFEQELFVKLPKPHDLATVNRVIDYKEATDTLRDALVSDRLQMLFREDDGNLGAPVAAHAWASETGLEALLRGTAWIVERHDEVCRFLLLPEAKVSILVNLAGKEPQGGDAFTSSAKASAGALKLLIEMMATSPDHPRPKDVVWPEFKARFPLLSERQFKERWREAASTAAPAWSRAGPRKRRPS